MSPAISLFNYPLVTVAASWVLMYFAHSMIVAIASFVALRFSAGPVARVNLLRVALIAPLFTATIVTAKRSPIDSALSVGSLYRTASPGIDVNVSRHIVNGNVSETRTVKDEPARRDSWILATLLLASAAIGLGSLARRVVRTRKLMALRIPMDAETATHLRQLVNGASSRSVRPAAGGASLNTCASVQFSVCDTLDSPVALWRHEIIVPPEFLRTPGAEQAAIMLHELAHLERRDSAWSLVFDIMVALTVCNPATHWLRAAHRRNVELAADHIATMRGAQPLSLIAALHRFVNAMEHGAPQFGTAFTRRPSLTIQRANVLADTDGAVSIGARTSAPWGVALLVVTAALLATAVPALTTASPVVGQREPMARAGNGQPEIIEDVQQIEVAR